VDASLNRNTDFEPVTFSASSLDFGSCSKSGTYEPKTLQVRNNTSSKIVVLWPLFIDFPDHPRESPSKKSGHFAIQKRKPGKYSFLVEPYLREIPSGDSALFSIHYTPEKENEISHMELECFAFFKCMLNFRLVPEIFSTPSWCYPLQVFGYVFPSLFSSLDFFLY
jgi:hypothetical protein